MPKSRYGDIADRLASAVGLNAGFAVDNTLIFSGSPTYAMLPDSASQTLARRTLNKVSPFSDLVVSMFLSGQQDSGAFQKFTAGLRIGGTDYAIASRYSKVVATGPPSRFNMDGIRTISGIPAGAIVIDPVFISTGVAQLTFFAGFDFISYEVREVK